jgi:hypothetical protein
MTIVSSQSMQGPLIGEERRTPRHYFRCNEGRNATDGLVSSNAFLRLSRRFGQPSGDAAQAGLS